MSKRPSKSNPCKVVAEPLIREIRGQKVILDADLAQVYGVTTKRLNEQIKRNRERFPEDFMFRLKPGETRDVRLQTAGEDSANWSQFATASKRNVRYLPFVFAEHGAIMAATILNSPQAVQMGIFVVRAFVRMKKMMPFSDGWAEELAGLKKELRD